MRPILYFHSVARANWLTGGIAYHTPVFTDHPILNVIWSAPFRDSGFAEANQRPTFHFV
jgi:hypothetical protein